MVLLHKQLPLREVVWDSMKFLYLGLVLLLIPITLTYGQTATGSVIILTDHQIGFDNDEITLNSTGSLDLSTLNSTAIVNSTQTVGGISVDLTKEITFVAAENDIIILKNIEFPSISVEIPNLTTISGPEAWPVNLFPPKQIAVTGIIPEGFDSPDNVIQIGSPDVILLFDKAVIISLDAFTGQTAYKLAGESQWKLISSCIGPFTSPVEPPFPTECSVTDGIDTKILTFHFTEFGGFPSTPPPSVSAPSSSESKSSSGGRGSSGSSGGGITKYGGFPTVTENQEPIKYIPSWLKSPVIWWNTGQITDEEFVNIITYVIDENIIDIDYNIKPDMPQIALAPSTKNLFLLWSEQSISEGVILGIIEYYRETGVW